MAAISTTLLTLLRGGDHAVLQEELYGGAHAFVADLFQRFGIDYSFVALAPEALQQAVTPRTKLLFLESPTNPLLRIDAPAARGGPGASQRSDHRDR